MKQAVIALLLAKSSKAQKLPKGGDPYSMDVHNASPKPILIADAWTDYKCSDGTVTAALATLTGLEGALATLKTGLTPLTTAVTTAVTANTAAVDAVVAKDTTNAAALATDDAADIKSLSLKTAMNTALYALNTAKGAAAAAGAAKGTADAAKSTADTLKSNLDAAKKAAATHYGKEQAQTITNKATYDAAQKAYLGASLDGLSAGTKYVAGTAKSTKTVADGVTKGVKDINDAALAKKTKELAVTADAKALYDAANTISDHAGTGKVVAKTAKNLLTTGKKNDITSPFNLWKADARTASDAYTTYANASEGWTKNANKKCATAQCVATSGATYDTKANCEGKCANLKAWNIDVVAASGAGDATYCLAYEHLHTTGSSGSKCKTCHTAEATVGGGTDTNYDCYVRTKTAKMKTAASKWDTSKTSKTLYTNYKTEVDQYKVASATSDGTQREYDMTKALTTALKSVYDAKKIISDASTNAYQDAGNSNAGTKKNYDAKKVLSDAADLQNTKKAADAAAGLLAMNNAKTVYDGQKLEEASQLALKNLADADAVVGVNGATTAKSGADTALAAKTKADAAQKTKQGEYDAAKKLYDAQVKVAAGTETAAKSAADELAALRLTATGKAGDLTKAMKAAKTQQDLIDAKQVAIGAAKAAHAAAIVKCQSTKYDAYRAALATAESGRNTKLDAIKKALDAAKKAAPAAGATGARCEKATSNGTGRAKRGAKTCPETDCCGAAKGKVGNAWMTIETCQAKATKKWSYVAPRAAMAAAAPAGVEWDFTCIDGAQKLYAAASALATFAYLMA